MKRVLLALCSSLLATAGIVHAQVSLPSTGYSQNFDSLGTAGTAPPTGWSHIGTLGGANSTWTNATGIPANGTTSAATAGTANNTLIVNSAAASGGISSNTQAYNLALAASTSDRCLGTSPTTGAGNILQLRLTNNTGAALSSIRLGYDTRRFTAVATANELPGHWLFYSTDGGNTWVNVSTLNPTLGTAGTVQVPNTVGVTTVPLTTINLASAVAAGAELRLRWIDDNAAETSPDQLQGLDNVVIQVANPPTVALTAPLAGASYTPPAPVVLTATASAVSPATLTKVEFLANGTKIGEATSAPYTFTWSGMTPLAYALTAVATDSNGLTATTAAVNITVVNTPPTISLASPAPNANYDAPATIPLVADAQDSDGTVTKVEYFANGTKLGQTTAAPHTFSWTGVFTGSYALTARATDDSGATTTSAAVNVTVTNTDNVAPTVAIATPGSTALPGDIVLSATAADADGTVVKVEYFNGAAKIGEATSAPFRATWSGVTAGSYTLTAVATDNDGATATSAALNLSVLPPTVSFAQNFDSMGATGTAAPSGWTIYSLSGGHDTFSFAPPSATTFLPNATSTAINVGTGTSTATTNATLTAWTSAAAASSAGGYNLGVTASSSDRALGSSPSGNAATELQWSLTNTAPSAVSVISVGYDLRRFTTTTNTNTAYDGGPYQGVEELPGYWLFYSLDNGATWTNVPTLNPTLAGSGVQMPNSIGTTTVPATNVVLNAPWASGAKLLLRWVDDNAQSPSPDQMIGLDNVTVGAEAALIGNPPTVAITTPANNAMFFTGASIPITATAQDSDGTIAKVEFYNADTKLGEATNAPYAFTINSASNGTYALTARATDNDGNITISSPVNVTVSAGPSGTLSRGPYLNSASHTQIVVRWRSSNSVVGRVRYGLATDALTQTVDETAAKTDHEVKLTGLTPYTRYYYSVGSNAGDSLTPQAAETTSFLTNAPVPTAADYTFRTSPTPGTAVSTRIWIVGDCGRGTQVQADGRDAYYAWMGNRFPDLNLQLGDNAYNSGTDTEYQSGYWNMYHNSFRKLPQWSCLGNHDANNGTTNPTTNFPYFDMFTFPTNGECGGVASGTEHYYSFDYGNIHFVCLDSQTTLANSSATAPQTVWLKADLAANTRTWTVVFFHHPTYSKGSHDSDTEGQMVTMRTYYAPILEQYGVDLVFVGHSHNYERSYLLDGHYGVSSTFAASMRKSTSNGSVAGFTTSASGVIRQAPNFSAVATTAGTAIPGGGAYLKPLIGPRGNNGTVYNTAGMSGLADAGSINHAAMYVSYNQVGTVNLDVNGNSLTCTFIQSGGATPDNFTIIKQGSLLKPDAFTLAATNVANTTATIRGKVNPNAMTTTAQFQSGLSTAYSGGTPVTLSPPDGTDDQTFSLDLTGLTPGATYYYRITATNNNGTTNGQDFSFTTPTLLQSWIASYGLTGADALATADPDGDGLTNDQEFQAGTSPVNAADKPRVAALAPQSDGSVVLQIPTAAGKTYRVEANNAFPGGVWTVVASNVAGTGGLVAVPDSAAASIPNRIYRVTVLP